MVGSRAVLKFYIKNINFLKKIWQTFCLWRKYHKYEVWWVFETWVVLQGIKWAILGFKISERVIKLARISLKSLTSLYKPMKAVWGVRLRSSSDRICSTVARPILFAKRAQSPLLPNNATSPANIPRSDLPTISPFQTAQSEIQNCNQIFNQQVLLIKSELLAGKSDFFWNLVRLEFVFLDPVGKRPGGGGRLCNILSTPLEHACAAFSFGSIQF